MKTRYRIRELSFTHDVANDFPTVETHEKLFDELRIERAILLRNNLHEWFPYPGGAVQNVNSTETAL
jgi:hypothetical protein